jgi:eukaryotic-like serine/threonine-protein kinase
MKGTIRDPTVTSFKDYGVVNEMYSIGHVLSYIFTGRESLKVDNSPVSGIIQRCVAHDLGKRYSTVIELIGEVESLREN